MRKFELRLEGAEKARNSFGVHEIAKLPTLGQRVLATDGAGVDQAYRVIAIERTPAGVEGLPNTDGIIFLTHIGPASEFGEQA